MNYTTVKQSRKLLKLGLNPKSADMVYLKYADSNNLTPRFEEAAPMVLWEIPIDEIDCETLPCWSLGALLEVMPDRIWGPDDEYGDPCAHELVFKAFGRTLEYEGILASDYRLSDAWFKQETDNLIDIFYNMVVWLLENNYIKK